MSFEIELFLRGERKSDPLVVSSVCQDLLCGKVRLGRGGFLDTLTPILSSKRQKIDNRIGYQVNEQSGFVTVPEEDL